MIFWTYVQFLWLFEEFFTCANVSKSIKIAPVLDKKQHQPACFTQKTAFFSHSEKGETIALSHKN